MSHLLLRKISPRLTCLLLRTQTPAAMSVSCTVASSGFPSSSEPKTVGKPKVSSHIATDLDPRINIQSSGIQSARVTLGFSRASLLYRKTMKVTVRNSATIGGIWSACYQRGETAERFIREMETQVILQSNCSKNAFIASFMGTRGRQPSRLRNFWFEKRFPFHSAAQCLRLNLLGKGPRNFAQSSQRAERK